MRLSTAADRDDAAAVELLHAAFAAGVDFLDTADAYCRDQSDVGHNERLIARALRSWSGDRTRIVVATKGGLIRPEGRWVPDGRARHLTAACAASRQALGVERLALYFLHAPDPRTPLGTSVRALAALKRDGLVERIGLSNVNLRQLEEALRRRPGRCVGGRAQRAPRHEPLERRRGALRGGAHPARGASAARRVREEVEAGARPGAHRAGGAARGDAVRDRAGVAPGPLAARASDSRGDAARVAAILGAGGRPRARRPGPRATRRAVSRRAPAPRRAPHPPGRAGVGRRGGAADGPAGGGQELTRAALRAGRLPPAQPGRARRPARRARARARARDRRRSAPRRARQHLRHAQVARADRRGGGAKRPACALRLAADAHRGCAGERGHPHAGALRAPARPRRDARRLEARPRRLPAGRPVPLRARARAARCIGRLLGGRGGAVPTGGRRLLRQPRARRLARRRRVAEPQRRALADDARRRGAPARAPRASAAPRRRGLPAAAA